MDHAAEEPQAQLPDFGTYPVEHALVAVAPEVEVVRVVWDDGRVSRFHHLWLRENCPCARCLEPVTREPRLDLSAMPGDLAARHAEVDAAGALRVRWTHEDHLSRYHPGWLRAHCYGDEARAERGAQGLPPPQTWDARFAKRLHRFPAHAVLDEEGPLREWLDALARDGVALLAGVPCDAGAVERVAARIGTVRETNFGRLFDVRSEARRDTSANTSLELLPHVDLPTREYQPGVQLLHCLVNDARGGDSVLVDGFRIAQILSRDEPEVFRVLCTVGYDFHNRSPESDYRWKSPVFVRDALGRVREVRYGAFLRGPLDLPFEQMSSAYRGWLRMGELVREPGLQVRFRLGAGDLLAFDNRRVLHGRTAFDQAGARHLRGCYVERDELLSRLRVLGRARG